jgi:hypothetical protein
MWDHIFPEILADPFIEDPRPVQVGQINALTFPIGSPHTSENKKPRKGADPSEE